MAIYQAINSHLEGDIEKIAKEMCLEINNFGLRQKEVIENISCLGVQTAFKMPRSYVCALDYSYDHGLYDDRNEKACEVSSRLIDYMPKKLTFQMELAKLYTNWRNMSEIIDPAIYISLYMASQHRTLQQTWARLMFAILLAYDADLYFDLPEGLKDDMQHLPMI